MYMYIDLIILGHFLYSGPSFERPHLNPNKNGLPNEVVFHQRRVEQ